MIVLDASVVIAYLEGSDAHHEAATRLIVDLVTEGEQMLALHPLTAAEVLTDFVQPGAAEEVWEDLVDIGFTICGLGEDAPAALLLAHVRRTTRLKMPDAVALATAIHQGARLATFDDALARASARHDALFASKQTFRQA